MLLVTRIDPFRAISDAEVTIELESGNPFENGTADLFRATWIDCRLVTDDVASGKHPTDRLARADQGSEIRLLILVDGRRHRDDVKVAALQCLDRRCEAEVFCGAQLFGRHLQRAVAAALQFSDPRAADVEADRLVVLAELDRQR